MKKFRVLSDLHLDPEINGQYNLALNDKEVFTLLCGDTAGEPEYGHRWILENIKHGLIISGNHMPYNHSNKTMQQQRLDLANRYPVSGDITYLDVEVGTFKKEVDGILFIGTCMYSNMKAHDFHNYSGDVNINKMTAKRYMNDYRFGIKSILRNLGPDNEPTFEKITPDDYIEWFNRSYDLIEKTLNENEQLKNPLPVVLFTHFPLVRKMMEDSYYDSVDGNFASYGNDMDEWILRHPSIKCYCCGHTHDVKKESRGFKMFRPDGSYCLVVNNARGYVGSGHDYNFNPDTFVNVELWEIEQISESLETVQDKKKRMELALAKLSMFF